MIKTLTVAECDVCGKTEPAKLVFGRYNENEYTLPEGWRRSETHRDFCICDGCIKRLEKPVVNYRSEEDVYQDRRH